MRSVVDSLPCTAPSTAAPGDHGRANFAMRCPVCLESIGNIDLADHSRTEKCKACDFILSSRGGIWRALAPAREKRFLRFMSEYQTLRAQEGRGSATADYYLGLPFVDRSGNNSWQWKVRARSYGYVESTILPVVERGSPRALSVLDVGAGNCWMSYRLALRGHNLVAVDLMDNEQDGLGSAKHYRDRLPRAFPCVQAEMDNLPFSPCQFDLAVFNASFHYSENYTRTMAEVLRCLQPNGNILVIDSPFYSHDNDGRVMVEEKHSYFERKFGFRSDALPSEEYLTVEKVGEVARAFGLRKAIAKPWYGVRWALRPWRARLGGKREPSKFWIAWFTAAVRE